MTSAATSYPLPKPALIWDRDDFADAIEAIETHPAVLRVRHSIADCVALINANNIDAMAEPIDTLQRILETAKDHAAAEYGLQWARRIRL